jgi:hypothetical protein
VTQTCNHSRRATGEVHLDLSRKSREHETYSTRLSVSVCATCGQVEFYADAAQDLFDWLLADKRGETS